MKSRMEEAISSGGVVAHVHHGKVELLLIRDTRYEDWTLPKGHVEAGETLEETALREIREEAGVTAARIVGELGTVRRYVERAQEWKQIHYFLILADPGEPTGTLESSYMETGWFSPHQLPKMYLPEQEKIIKENIKKIEKLKGDANT